MTNTIRSRSGATIWRERHEPAAPKVGEEAPDFTLADVAGTQPVRLSDFRGKRPVALVFGSFT